MERASYANTVLLPLAAAVAWAAGCVPRWPAPGPMTPREGKERCAQTCAPPPALLNALFGAVLGLEAALLTRVDLPIGLSAFVVARRPG